MKLSDSVNSIILWLRATENQLDHLEQSPLWKSVTEAIPGDYVSVNFNEHINSAVAEIFDLANRFEELQVQLKTETESEHE